MTELLVEVWDRVATLTLNRPTQRNTLSAGLLTALTGELRRLREDREVRAVIITGAGEQAFCAGGDLTSMAGGGFFDGHLARQAYMDLLETMHDAGKPLIAAVNGAALGGGLGLMLACDLAVAAESATFGTPEVKVGLFPMMAGALLLRHLGPKQAMHTALTGERLTAHRALELGLVNRVVPGTDLAQAGRDLAGQVASLSPAVLRLGREALHTAAGMEYRQALRYLHAMLSINTQTEDAAEGVSAFLTKRPPEWQGR